MPSPDSEHREPEHPVNPFASPATTRLALQEFSAESPGLWREGDLLVMHRRATLPRRCVVTGAEADVSVPHIVSWCHPLWYLSLLAGPIPALIVVCIVSRQASVDLPLSRPVYLRRRRKIRIAWGIGLAGVLSFWLSLALGDYWPLGITLGFLLLIAVWILGNTWSRTLKPQRIVGPYVWLKGAHPNVLSSLEPWHPDYR